MLVIHELPKPFIFSVRFFIYTLIIPIKPPKIYPKFQRIYEGALHATKTDW